LKYDFLNKLGILSLANVDIHTSIGKDVCIHGVPTNGDKLIDTQVNEVYRVARSGTLVEIIP
jgi:hypothetical protein